MKKLILGLGAVIVAGFIVTQAMAWNGYTQRGYGPMAGTRGAAFHGDAYHQGWNHAGHHAAARAELRREMSRANPDMQKVRALRRHVAGNRDGVRVNSKRHVRHNNGYSHRNGHGGSMNCW